MEKRLALVVDDSLTARETLRRMLEQHNLAVDTLDSAQATLDYLKRQTPDVIFMDHMMPGMDGFQAVEAIKGNPDTATIPIMMYTSKEGDLYVSQARALGAVGILPKQVQPAELFEVLNKLGLVHERRSKRNPESRLVLLEPPPREVALSAAREQISDIADQAARAVHAHHVSPGQIAELLERHHARLQESLRELQDDLARPAGKPGSGAWLPLLAILLMLVPLLWVYRQNETTQTALDQAHRHIEQLLAAQHTRTGSMAAADASLHAPQQQRGSRDAAQATQVYDTIAWAINQGSAYDMNQAAFGDARLAMVQELVSRLGELGFHGIVQLESHLGEFCLSGGAGDRLKLAAPDTPITECSLIGHPRQQSADAGVRQSIAFANFLATSPLLNHGGIRIEIVPVLFSRPRIAYPPRESDVTAQDWNRIAAANNRVEVRLLPDTE
jgi:CheY-like chemotaxis protein